MGAPAATTPAAMPAAAGGGFPWLQVSGASPDEVAKLQQLLAGASASPSAQRLFADLSRTGLRVEVKDDASDPSFADPKVIGYQQGGVVTLRRSELANMVTGQRMLNTLLHEAIHAADVLDRSRINPALEEIRQRSGGQLGQQQYLTELTALMESRAFVGADQIMRELGHAGPRSGGFGITGVSLASQAASILRDPGYATGISTSITQGLPDAILGHALLGG